MVKIDAIVSYMSLCFKFGRLLGLTTCLGQGARFWLVVSAFSSGVL